MSFRQVLLATACLAGTAHAQGPVSGSLVAPPVLSGSGSPTAGAGSPGQIYEDLSGHAEWYNIGGTWTQLGLLSAPTASPIPPPTPFALPVTSGLVFNVSATGSSSTSHIVEAVSGSVVSAGINGGTTALVLNPTGMNGHPDFVGVNDQIVVPATALLAGNTDMDLYCTFQETGTSGSFEAITQGPNWFDGPQNNVTTLHTYSYANSANVQGNPGITPALNTTHIRRLQYYAATNTLYSYIDGVEDATGAITLTNQGGTPSLLLMNGASMNLGNCAGYNRVLADSEQEATQTYLAGYYGVSGYTATAQQAPPAPATVFSNYITASPLPTVADPTDPTVYPVGWPSSDDANLQSVAAFSFGTGANGSPADPAVNSAAAITSEAQIRQHFEYNQLDGTAGSNTGGGKETNSAFDAVFREYPIGDVHDTITMTAQGAQFNTFCSGSSGTVCNGAQDMVTGMLRPETQVTEGDIVQACYKGTSGPAGWFTYWLLAGAYPAAGSGASYYGTSGTANAGPFQVSTYGEADIPDGYAFHDLASANAAQSQSGDLGVPQYDLTYNYPTLSIASSVSAHGAPNLSGPGTQLFAANDGTLYKDGSSGINAVYDRSAAVHCYQTEITPTTWTDATHTRVASAASAGTLRNSIDGKLVEVVQDNMSAGVEQDWTGATVSGGIVPYAIMVGQQYGATFLPNALASLTPANVAADHAVLASLRVWKRTGGTPPAATLANGATPPAASVAAQSPPSGLHEMTFGSGGEANAAAVAAARPGAGSAFVMTANIAPTAADIASGSVAALFGTWGIEGFREETMRLSGNTLICAWTSDPGNNTGSYSINTSAALGLTAGQFATVECDNNTSTGVTTFWVTPQGGTRAQVGGAVTGTANVTIATSSAGKPSIGEDGDGSSQFHGSMAGATLTIGGTLELAPVATATGITDSAGNAWASNADVGFQ